MEQRSAGGKQLYDTTTTTFPIIVHSHLRWDFVWQRPQQILSRLAAHHPVLFVEEPVFEDDIARPRLQLSRPHAGVVRAVPHVPRAHNGKSPAAIVRGLLRLALGKGGALDGQFRHPVQWFYTPMPAPEMLGAFGERGVVYDCMDELSQFAFAPPQLADNERRLLRRADIVFTGGYRLYRSKSRLHDNVHFFGCGVEVAHFARARAPETPRPADLAHIHGPILGYVGVIDERLDYALIDALAAARDDWQVVMVGPAAKVDPARFPRRANLHWLGQKSYAELPGYVKSFDVCLMPFALNHATEYINPTKTLEYMAAGKPIVSSAVPDVVHNFGSIVHVAMSSDEFVALADAAVRERDEARVAQGIARAETQTWDAIVAAMRQLMIDAVAPAGQSRPAAERADAPARRRVSGGFVVAARGDGPLADDRL